MIPGSILLESTIPRAYLLVLCPTGVHMFLHSISLFFFLFYSLQSGQNIYSSGFMWTLQCRRFSLAVVIYCTRQQWAQQVFQSIMVLTMFNSVQLIRPLYSALLTLNELAWQTNISGWSHYPACPVALLLLCFTLQVYFLALLLLR